MQEHALIIRPVRPQPFYSLDFLLAGVTEDNLHGETDWGGPEGNDVS